EGVGGVRGQEWLRLRLRLLARVSGLVAGGYRPWFSARQLRRGHGVRRRRWLGFWFPRRHRLGLLGRVCLLSLGWRRPPAATGADIFVDEVLDHEQRRRPVIELFAPVRADIDAHLAAGRAGAVGLGQLVMPGL